MKTEQPKQWTFNGTLNFPDWLRGKVHWVDAKLIIKGTNEVVEQGDTILIMNNGSIVVEQKMTQVISDIAKKISVIQADAYESVLQALLEHVDNDTSRIAVHICQDFASNEEQRQIYVDGIKRFTITFHNGTISK